MTIRRISPVFLVFCAVFAQAQTHDFGFYPDTLRGEAWIDLDPVYGDRVDIESPLTPEISGRRVLQETALYFSGMIYGWSFHYHIGERARGIAEDFSVFEPMGEIVWGDPRMRITEVENRDMQLRLWADYHMDEAQQRRIHLWRTGTSRNAQAMGYVSIFGSSPDDGWFEIRNALIKDAARAAVREMLRGTERNRPKEASGFISLASFPRFFMDSGQWAAEVRFRVQINEIIPFAVH
ncbi:MAG: hypothetical protein FWG89_00780 [Treponema sp.]|nr:hypothetical protein [Treponema sp.]